MKKVRKQIYIPLRKIYFGQQHSWYGNNDGSYEQRQISFESREQRQISFGPREQRQISILAIFGRSKNKVWTRRSIHTLGFQESGVFSIAPPSLPNPISMSLCVGLVCYGNTIPEKREWLTSRNSWLWVLVYNLINHGPLAVYYIHLFYLVIFTLQ